MIEKLPSLPPLVEGKKPEDVTVVVAMSGGVDSSVTAAWLAKLGYKTIGVTMQLWDYSSADTEKKLGTCCALDDVFDAKMVCKQVGIDHHVMNVEGAFKEAVIDDFVETYLSGATPVPCVRCNQRIKFVGLLEKAKELGADVLVTGHYIQKVEDEHGQSMLKMGTDDSKDQSYYLFATTREQLDFLAFPLGHLKKTETRELAKFLNLHVHAKRDSFDICFVPGGDYRKVVKKFAPDAQKQGNIIKANGEVVGTHDGIVGYTVGQRKGLGGGWTEPMYVTDIRAETNEIVIGPEADLFKTEFTVKELNWLDAHKVADKREVLVKVRAQHQAAPAILSDLGGGRLLVKTVTPTRQISPGQAAVFFNEEHLMLGGGWIEP